MVDDLLIRVDAQVAEFNAAFGSATKSTIQLEAALKRASAQQALYQQQVTKYGAESAAAQSALAKAQMSNAALAEKQALIQKRALEAQAAAYRSAGRGFITAGGAIAVGLGLSAKAAIDWQAAFTGVRQALEGSPQQIQAVDDGLRDLARTLPTTHDQLAQIARDAAQTGVATGDIVGFTKVVAELGTTAPDLQDGATALARFLNVTGTSTSQVENVASAMTKLGQAGASTVSEISDLGLRLAGAGRTAGLTNGEILGLANAMTSLGLPVETAGTNFSKTLLTINTAVSAGGENLKIFAEIAGQSAEQFAAAYRDDAATAIQKFLIGLGEVKASGGDVATTLGALGITSQRQIDVLNRLSQNTDLVAKSLETGNQAYRDNAALQDTFAKQLETTQSQLQIASNNVNDLGISIGQTLAPAIADAAQKGTELLTFLSGLPGPAKDAAQALTAITLATTLLGGGSLLASARIATMKASLLTLSETSGRTVLTLAGMRLAAAGLAGGLIYLNSQVDDSNEGLSGLLDVATGAAVGFSVTGGPWGAAIGAVVGLGKAFLGTSGDAQTAAGSVQDFQKTLDPLTAAITRTTRAFAAQKLEDAGILGFAARHGIDPSQIVDAVTGSTVDLSLAQARLNETLGAAKARYDATVAAQEAYATRLASQTTVTVSQQNHLDALTNAMGHAGDQYFGLKEKVDGFNKTLVQNRDNLENSRREQRLVTAGTRDHAVEVDKLHAILDDLPPEVATQIKALGVESSRQDVAQLIAQYDLTPAEKTTLFRALGFDAATQAAREWQATLDRLQDKTITITTVFERHGQTPPGSATGGYVRGPGTSTSDSIPAMLSDGEYVVRAAAVKSIGLSNLQRMNARGYATGGSVGGAAQSGSISVAELLKLLSGGGAATLARVNALLAERNRLEQIEFRDLVDMRGARERLHNATKRLNVLEHDDAATKEQIAAAQKLVDQRQKDLAKSEKELDKARQASSDAMGKFKSALDSLTQTIQSRVDQVTALADPFGGEGTSLSAQGLLAKKRAVASDAREMTVDLGILRRKGADKDIIAELRAQGPTQDTLTLLRSLIVEPKSYFRQLNTAERHVGGAARSLASFGIPGAGGTHVQTQIQRQANVNIGRIEVADRRGYERATRRAAERALAMT